MNIPQQPPNTTFTPGWSGYTADWFSHRIPQWEQFIKPVYAGKPCRWLELGSYEGRSAIWTLDNILTHPDSTIHCVDIWAGEYEKNFDANVKSREGRDASKIYKCKMDVVDWLGSAVGHASFGRTPSLQKFDVVYVDADHQAKSALTDAALAWLMLKPGGFLIFDDYPWKHPETDPDRHRKLGPQKGIDAFLDCWQYELQVIHKGYQVIVRKNL